MIKTIMRRAGYRVAPEPSLLYGSREELKRFTDVVRPFTMLPDDRLISLYDQVRFCERERIEGAFVECGVWKGGAVGLMALAAGGAAARRDLHLFDAFDDICEPDPAVDGDKALSEARRIGNPSGRLQPLDGFYDDVGGHGTLEVCRGLIEETIGYPSDRVHYHVGWFQNTLPVVAPGIGKIAVLRLDGDWYASTKVCLEHLFEHVVPGGFVVIDDYGTYSGCSKAVDEFLADQGIKAYLQQVDQGCYYLVKPQL